MKFENSLKKTFLIDFAIASTCLSLCGIMILCSFYVYRKHLKALNLIEKTELHTNTSHFKSLLHYNEQSQNSLTAAKLGVVSILEYFKKEKVNFQQHKLTDLHNALVNEFNFQSEVLDANHPENSEKFLTSTKKITNILNDKTNTTFDSLRKRKNIFNSLTILLIVGSVAWIGFRLYFFLKKDIFESLLGVLEYGKKISKGNLVKVENRLREDNEISALHNILNEISDYFKNSIASITNTADNIAIASQQLSSTSQQLSQGTNEQSVSVEEISSTIEEMTVSIQQSKENAYLTEQISVEALQGIFEVSDESMKAVDASESIAKEVKQLNHITFQTNLLSLNAAVEAARIGSQGRGFGVVATEVGKLADNSRNVSGKISELAIGGLDISKESCDKLTNILPEIQKTSSLLQEMAATSDEQANGALQINTAIQQLNTITQQIAAASEELAANAEEMSVQADTLKSSMKSFNIVDHNIQSN